MPRKLEPVTRRKGIGRRLQRSGYGDRRLGDFDPETLSKVHWVRPEVVVEVTYLTWTQDNLLRQVSYQGSCGTSQLRRLFGLFRTPPPLIRPVAW